MLLRKCKYIYYKKVNYDQYTWRKKTTFYGSDLDHIYHEIGKKNRFYESGQIRNPLSSKTN